MRQTNTEDANSWIWQENIKKLSKGSVQTQGRHELLGMRKLWSKQHVYDSERYLELFKHNKQGTHLSVEQGVKAVQSDQRATVIIIFIDYFEKEKGHQHPIIYWVIGAFKNWDLSRRHRICQFWTPSTFTYSPTSKGCSRVANPSIASYLWRVDN